MPLIQQFKSFLSAQTDERARKDNIQIDKDLANLFSALAFYPQSVVCTAAEAMTAPTVVHLYDSSGLTARKADNTTPPDYFARGIYLGASSVTSGDSMEVHLIALVPYYTGLTPGATYYLSGTPGGITSTAPISGRVQKVGFAVSATELYFNPELV